MDNCLQHNSGPSPVTLQVSSPLLMSLCSPLISDLCEATTIHIILHCRHFWLQLSYDILTELVSFASIWKELWSKSKVFTYV